MSNNINYRLKTEMGNTLNVLQKVGQAYGNLGKNVSKSNAGFAKAFTSIKKTNRSFTNLTKDVNRANKSLIGMNGSLLNLRTLIGTIGFYRLAQGLTQAISSAMDMIETANLFSVAMGTLAVETNKALVEISSITGLDLTNMQTAVGTFGALSRSMGLTSKASQQLSTTTYRLGLDLASLYNVNINQALQDLRSGLVGQSETVYKYGIDVTEAALKVEALNQGITKSVRNMSQGEKMALRYAVMIRQSSVAHGDFARTLEQPANQLRILRERFVTLGRSIGTIFVPALQAVLPWLNAIVKVLINIANVIARILGYDSSVADIWDFDSGVGGVAEDANDLEDGLSSAGKEAKKLQGQLMGFDEINLWKEPSDNASAGGSAGTGAIAGGVDMSWMEDLTYDSGFDTIATKADKMAEEILNSLGKIWDGIYRLRYAINDLWDEGLSLLSGFSFGVLSDFYNSFLVPVGKWMFGEGLPKLVNIFNDMLKKIDWGTIRQSLDNVWKALAPFAVVIGEGLLMFLEKVLVPLALWAINNIIPFALDLVAEGLVILTGATKGFEKTKYSLLDNYLIPLAGFLTGVLKEAWQKVIDIMKWLHEKIIKPLIDILRILWENILAPFAIFIKDVLSIAFEFWRDILVSLWENVLLPLASFIIEVFVEALNGLRDTLIYLEPAINVIRDAFMFLWDFVLKPLLAYLAGDFSTTVNNVFENLGTAIEGLKEIFKGLINFVVGVLTGDWKRAFTGIGNIVIAVLNTIISSFENALNWIIDKINNLAELANEILADLGASFRIDTLSRFELSRLDYLKYDSSPATKPLAQYANGGFPTAGELFIAREAGAELVGNLGGRSAVVNNDQIVEAVSAGVYQAVASAMSVNSGGSGQASEVTLEIDGTKLGRVLLPKMNGESKRLGYKPILEVR